MDIDINIVLCSAVGAACVCVGGAWCYVGYTEAAKNRLQAAEALSLHAEELEAKRGQQDLTQMSTSAEVVFV